MNSLILLVIFAPLAGFAINLLFGPTSGKRLVSIVGCLSALASFAFSLFVYSTAETFEFSLVRWIPLDAVAGSLDIAFLADNLSLSMALIVAGIGFVIHFYSIGYMWRDKRYHTYFAYLNLFIFFMLMLVFSANFLTMFIGWEGVGLCSFLLIGFWHEEFYRARAAQKAFITNRVGDAFFILACVMLLSTASTLNFSDLMASKGTLLSTSYAGIGAAGVFLFLSCCGKSAQIPLYVWLPDAMAGPSPVSALIHAATMVTAGVFLFLRTGELFLSVDAVRNFILIIGSLTAIFSAMMATCEFNIKKVLAYSTISQLGYMFCGLASPCAAFSHLLTHAFFKALLFLSAGYIIHALHNEEDIRKMGGLFRLDKARAAGFSFLVGSLALAGVPPFAGFFSKENIFMALWGGGVQTFALTILMLVSVITAVYIFRVFWYVFLRKTETHNDFHSDKIMSFSLTALSLLTLACPLLIGSTEQLWHTLAHTFTSVFGLLTLAVILLIIAVNYVYSKGLVDKWVYKPAYAVISNKFYVDFLIDFLIITPLKMISFILWYLIDNLVIESSIVRGLSSGMYKLSALISPLQKCSANEYIFMMSLSTGFLALYSLNAISEMLVVTLFAVGLAAYLFGRRSLWGGAR